MKSISYVVSRCCLTLIFAIALCSFAKAQTLTTDRGDYPPGSWVTITGTGFTSGEVVTLRVTHNPTGGDDATATDHQPWDIDADANGAFVSSWWCPSDLDELGAHLIATADGH